jgi:hypothetical protein
MATVATDFKVDVKMDVADFESITREAVKVLAKELEGAERANIAAAGMARYAKRTNVTVSGRGKNWTINVRSRPNWMRAHEYGATSIGKPMLWIPVNTPLRHQRASGYPVKLFRPPGTNVLINTKTRRVAYVGIPAATIRPRLQMREIAEKYAAKFVENLQVYTAQAPKSP